MCRKVELTPCQRFYGFRPRASTWIVKVPYFSYPLMSENDILYARVTKNLLHLVDPVFANVLQQCVLLLKNLMTAPLTILKEFSSPILRVI